MSISFEKIVSLLPARLQKNAMRILIASHLEAKYPQEIAQEFEIPVSMVNETLKAFQKIGKKYSPADFMV